MTIITKDKTSDSGNKLKFDNNGIIVENSKFARQVSEKLLCAIYNLTYQMIT